ncbi:MAG: hypothetical protein ACHRHE_17005 [Tepidisphaerales bacterium]
MRDARHVAMAGLMLAALAMLCRPAMAQPMRRVIGGNQPAAGGNVNLPYSFSDGQGNTFQIYQYGQIQMQGNWPVYSQGAMLQVNGNYVQAPNNQGKVDEKTGELVLANMPGANVSVTRRIMCNKEEGWIRYIDIIKNTSNQEVTPNLMYNTNLNYGVASTSTVEDPKKKGQTMAWIAQTQANNKTCVELFAGKGAKSAPIFQYQAGNSNINISYAPAIPGGKEIALMHFHLVTTSPDAGQKFVLGLKENKIMAAIPAAIRRLIVNFRGGENFIGDFEILRGEMLDVVELRTGDQLKGTLKEKTFKLQTFYGPIELPVDDVIGLINIGEFRPRQLLVTKDGEVFGGKLDRDKLSLELSSGQLTEIPVLQVSRMGYRKRAGEPEEWTFEKPMVLMRSGDRMGVQAPAKDIEVSTRYGTLKLSPSVVAAINFQAEEHGVHDIYLIDGSKFAGLVNADVFDMKLSSSGPEQLVKFPAASIRRLQLAKRSEEDDATQPVLSLANQDVMVGVLDGGLKLDTAFSTLNLAGTEIKKMVKTAGSPSDVQVVMWDDTTVTGQLQEQELTVKLACGVTMKVPVALMSEYNQPRPAPSKTVIESIKQLVAELNAEDWKQRDGAQEKLIQMGVVVAPTLKQLRGSATPEAQQRIDQILKAVEKDVVKPKPAAAGAANPGAGGGQQMQMDVNMPVPQVQIAH